MTTLYDHLEIVVNGASRRGRAALPALCRELEDTGLAPHAHVVAVTSGAELLEALDAAVRRDPHLLVVGGGDGSVAAAAARVAGTGVALGVLPLGTANDFARTVQLPTGLAEAVRTLRAGKVVDVDLGTAVGTDGGERPFLNVASLGLSVAVTQRLSGPRGQLLKRRLGPLAYPVATLAAYRRHRGLAARLDFPDGDHASLELDDLLQVAVGNGVHYGGGNTVSPTASVDDHTLDVYAIVRGRLREHVSLSRLLKDGSLVEHERVHHLLTRRVRVSTPEPVPVNLDGELTLRTPVELTVHRNAVDVVVPQDSDGARRDREVSTGSVTAWGSL